MQTQLFETTDSSSALTVLSKDGRADYFPSIFESDRCAELFSALIDSLDWRVDQIYMFGKLVTTKRKVAWVGDAGCSYKYSGVKKEPQPWTPELLHIKNQLEKISQWKFNSCLLNLYHDGDEGMGWHSDDEKEIVPNSSIASLSIGAERKFAFKHKTTKETVNLILENGSLLEMKGPIQQYWWHSLPKTKKVQAPRINLTFRQMR